MRFFKKTTSRRDQVRKNIADDDLVTKLGQVSPKYVGPSLQWLVFTLAAICVLSFEPLSKKEYIQALPMSYLVLLLAVGIAFHIYHYQKRIIKNNARAFAVGSLFIILLITAKFGFQLTRHNAWATATAVTFSIILTIAYDQRFALGMSLFFCLLAGLAVNNLASINLFIIMMTGVCCASLSLKEIRTRMKLLEVGTFTAVVIFITAAVLDKLSGYDLNGEIFKRAGYHAGFAFLTALLIQSLLPIIEKAFKIATSMTLLDYSDANQPLLKKLAMEAPGTFSHSLLVGSVAEAAAETIGRNGLLCRVGAYYHDIGKLNKPSYFTENEMGSASRHKELSPTMSQLIIIGHVKDGIEMAKEYGLPAILRQFIETHHGTTLIEYFYHEAQKKQDESLSVVTENEFRYAGPKPQTKEAAIVMIADNSEGAVRAITEITPSKVENAVHNMAMKRLQDGQFDECDLSLKELSQIEASISKSLVAHHHGRVAYPKIQEYEQEEPVIQTGN
jgi:cyclic-di-AMP phosphodiesterase PgpH